MKIVSGLLGGHRQVVPVGVLLALVFLFVDAGVDSLFFDEEKRGFVENLFEPEPMDQWMRAVVMVVVVGFSFYARRLLWLQREAADALQRERDLLELRVAEATEELRSHNEVLRNEIVARQKVEHELKELSETDPLTRLYNRRKLLEEMAVAIAVDRRYHTGLSLIICDIDHFKQINDMFGHDVGDAVLQQFAGLLRQYTRESDTLARWGGEEFALLLPQANAERAQAIAEKLRLLVEQADFGSKCKVTFSAGVALFTGEETAEQLIKRADTALYAAKAGGRNRVVRADCAAGGSAPVAC